MLAATKLLYLKPYNFAVMQQFQPLLRQYGFVTCSMKVCSGEVVSQITFFFLTNEVTFAVTEMLNITVYGCQIIVRR